MHMKIHILIQNVYEAIYRLDIALFLHRIFHLKKWYVQLIPRFEYLLMTMWLWIFIYCYSNLIGPILKRLYAQLLLHFAFPQIFHAYLLPILLQSISKCMEVLFNHFSRSYSPLSLFILKKLYSKLLHVHSIWRGFPQKRYMLAYNCRQINKSLQVWVNHFWKYSYILNGMTSYFFSKDEECGESGGIRHLFLCLK